MCSTVISYSGSLVIRTSIIWILHYPNWVSHAIIIFIANKHLELGELPWNAVDDRSDSSWPWLSSYHSNGKTIVSVALFLLHSKSFTDKRRPNGFEHMMASNNTLKWVHLSARHCSHHGYERRDCVNWPRPSIIYLTEHFTYPNEFLVAVGHRGLDNRGSTVWVLLSCVAIIVHQAVMYYIYNVVSENDCDVCLGS